MWKGQNQMHNGRDNGISEYLKDTSEVAPWIADYNFTKASNTVTSIYGE